MKSKKAVKKNPRKNAPVASSTIVHGEGILPGAEHFVNLQKLSPRDFVMQAFGPQLKDASDEVVKAVIDGLAGMVSGVPDFYDFQVPLPEWVPVASKKFFESSGLDFNKIKNGDVAEIGKCIGLVGLSESKQPTETDRATTDFAEALKIEAAKSPAKDASHFFSGAEKAVQIRDRLKEPPKRIKVFMIMAASWRQVEQLKSAGELHRWLVEIDAFEGSITDPAETRKICRLIGKSFGNAAGRPAAQK